MEVRWIVSSMATGTAKNGVVGRVGMAVSAGAILLTVFDWEERVIAGWQVGGYPAGRRVTSRAGRWPSCTGVVRVRRAVETGGVAGVAARRRPRKNIVDVTLIATDVDMGACQRKWRAVMVEGRPRPGRRRMARCAGRGEACRGMIGTVRPVVIRLMTADAGCRHARIVALGVTQRALQRGVRACQRERCAVVIE